MNIRRFKDGVEVHFDIESSPSHGCVTMMVSVSTLFGKDDDVGVRVARLAVEDFKNDTQKHDDAIKAFVLSCIAPELRKYVN